jgi:stage IV sporulation protein FB
MLTAFRTVAPEDRLSTAIELVQHGGQHDIPVVQGGRLVGLLTRHDLLQAVRERGPQSLVADAMDSDILVVAPQDILDTALTRLDAHQLSTAPVVQDGRFVGLLTAEAVAEFIKFRAALDHAA